MVEEERTRKEGRDEKRSSAGVDEEWKKDEVGEDE
jgi:hypothetical protein